MAICCVQLISIYQDLHNNFRKTLYLEENQRHIAKPDHKTDRIKATAALFNSHVLCHSLCLLQN